MTDGKLKRENRPLRVVLLAAAMTLVSLAACRREDIAVYTVPKQRPAQGSEGPQMAHAPGAAAPRVTWKKPPGWEQGEPDGMRVARFAASGPAGQQADIVIIPLPGVQASREDLVNIWRDQIHLPPASADELTKSAQPVPIGPVTGELQEMVSAEAILESKFKARVLVALARHDSAVWVFKIAGADELVQAQKPQFVEFLKSIAFVDAGALPDGHPPVAAAGAGAPPPGAGPAQLDPDAPAKPAWQVPAGWQEAPPTQMIIAKFLLSGEGGAKAEVSVSAFPGDTGGLLANVNRWRRQIGLAAVPEAELGQLVSRVDLSAGKASLVDMRGTDAKTSQPARLIGAIVPRGGQTWFFKLLGNDQVASREKAAFLKFVQSVKFPDA